MIIAALGLMDFFMIAVIVAVVAGGAGRSRPSFRRADRERLDRLEQKLDLLLRDAGLDYTPPPRASWQELADEVPPRTIEAIKAYREQTGAGLAEARQAVEAYIGGRGA